MAVLWEEKEMSLSDKISLIFETVIVDKPDNYLPVGSNVIKAEDVKAFIKELKKRIITSSEKEIWLRTSQGEGFLDIIDELAGEGLK